jgi:hypothetical protein
MGRHHDIARAAHADRAWWAGERGDSPPRPGRNAVGHRPQLQRPPEYDFTVNKVTVRQAFSKICRWGGKFFGFLTSVLKIIFTLIVVFFLLCYKVIASACKKIDVPRFTAFLTLLLALATAALAFVAYRQTRIMENDQRPWIKVEVEIASPLDFTVGGWGIMRLRLTLTNVGKSPAFNVRLAHWGFLNFEGHNDPHKEQRERCERFRGEPLDNPARGSVLFPGDHLPWDRMGGAFTSGIAFPPDEIRKGLVEENGLGHLNISIFGCADYVFSALRQHHQTGFNYSLAQIIPREGMPAALTFGIAPQGSISADQLCLFPSPSASGQTD